MGRKGERKEGEGQGGLLKGCRSHIKELGLFFFLRAWEPLMGFKQNLM